MNTYCANAIGRARLLASITSHGFFGFDQPDFKRVTREAGDIMQIELSHQVGPVVVHRLDADPEFRGNFLGAVTFRNKLQNLAFPVGQKIRCAARVRVSHDVAQQRGDGGPEVGATIRNRLQPTLKFEKPRGFFHEAVGAGL